MTTPSVEASYADGSQNTIRPQSQTYPDGRVVSDDYGTAGDIDDHAGRIAALVDDDDTPLAEYQYLGLGAVVQQDSPEADLRYTLVSLTGGNDPDTGDIYAGLDRFGRVKDVRWRKVSAGSDLSRIRYGYDRASNRVWRQNPSDPAGQFDWLYVYDGVHRLKDMGRGTLDAERTALTSETFAQCWNLDSTGNWHGFREDSDGNGSWDFIQQRTANPVNEITDISETAGPTWVTPAYDPAGNMTTMPKVADPTVSQNCQYDAWNRLTKVSEGDDTIASSQYDGAKRRIVQRSYDSGVLSETRHLYYTEPSKWQAIEERVGTSPDSADAERQFVWGLRYIDDCLLRDRDTNADGTLNERLYACRDANWNVTSIVDTSKTVQERYAYAAYGTPDFLTADFGSRAESMFIWSELYAGYQYMPISALYLVRNRGLNTVLGSWLQRDPDAIASVSYRRHAGGTVSRTDGDNLYSYVTTNPLSQLDPSGLAGQNTVFNLLCFCRNPQRPWNERCNPSTPCGILLAPPLPPPGPGGPGPGTPCNYPNRLIDLGFQSAQSQCVCQCAGNSPYMNCVRGCIQCANDNGGPAKVATEFACRAMCGQPTANEAKRLNCCINETCNAGGCAGVPGISPPCLNPNPNNPACTGIKIP